MIIAIPLFLAGIAAAALATIAGRRAVRRAGAHMFLAAITPKVSFGDGTTPPAPDYTDDAAWAVTPRHPRNAALALPGQPVIDPERAPVDAFFIHPTTFFGTRSWNAAIDDERASEGVDQLVIPSQASVFNARCRIYAPRYRQATLYSFVGPDDNGRRALELAYGDVARAFAHYLEHYNQGRPFVLASHSQGTCHAIRLLEERICGTPLTDRLVAAYLIGYWLPEDKLTTSLAATPACAGPDDTGCLIAWDSFGAVGGPDHRRDRAEHWYATGDGRGEWRRRAGSRPLCVNPLTGRRSEEPAPAALNLGGVHPVLDGPRLGMNLFVGEQPIGYRATALSRPYPGLVSARCGPDGFLYVSRPSPAVFRRAVLPGVNYHNYDYGLFWMNIRADVARRVRAYLSRKSVGT